MIKLIITWVLKLAFQFVFWFFVFSIKINNKTFFTQTSEYIEKNKVVQSFSDKAEELWYFIRKTLSQKVDEGM